MRQLLKKLQDFALVGAAGILLLILTLFFLWGFAFLVQNVSQAVSAPDAKELQVNFNLEEAATLDFRGLKASQ